MKSKIYNPTGPSGITGALAWTRDSEEPLVYLKSGQKSGCLSFLKYQGQHETGSSWNPADLYGESVLGALGIDPGAYQELESVLLPTLTEEDIESDLRFFGQVLIGSSEVALLRFPEGVYRVDIYPEAPTTKDPITFGTDPYLQVDFDTTEEVSEKILAIEIHSAGVGQINSLNLSGGAWRLEENPERNKHLWAASKGALPASRRNSGPYQTDTVTGRLLSTIKYDSGLPLRTLITNESSSAINTWTNSRVYREGEQVVYKSSIYESKVSENIDEIPGLSGFWKLANGLSGFQPAQSNRYIVNLTTDGPGKLYFPGTSTELTGKIGTSDLYIRFKVVPESGYVMENSSYSYLFGEYVNNLVSEGNNTYILRIGPSYGGYDFCITFRRSILTVVTDYQFTGTNYWSDGHDTGVTYQDPMKLGPTDIRVEYQTESSNTADSTSITIQSDIDNPLTIRYVGLAKYYVVQGVTFKQWSQGLELVSEESPEFTVSGDDLVLTVLPKEPSNHVCLDLSTVQVLVTIEPGPNQELSMSEVLLYPGEDLKFSVYSETEPSLEGAQITPGVAAGTWDIVVTGIMTSQTITLE